MFSVKVFIMPHKDFRILQKLKEGIVNKNKSFLV
jgi:hypothetical protein